MIFLQITLIKMIFSLAYGRIQFILRWEPDMYRLTSEKKVLNLTYERDRIHCEMGAGNDDLICR